MSRSQPLPAPSQPATVAAAPAPTYTPAAYRELRRLSFECSIFRCNGVGLGSLDLERRFAGDGGSGPDGREIAHKHGVPVSALMQTNGIREPGQIRPGQRLVIPRYVSTSPKSAPTYAAQPKAGGSVHVVKAGETLMSISRGTGVSVAALAKTNHIESSKKLQRRRSADHSAGWSSGRSRPTARDSQGRGASHCSG